MKPDQPKREPVHVQFAEKVIAMLEAGTAPWQKPWHPGAGAPAPYNPLSGTVYRGMNRVWLAMAGHADPRWMTFKQAAEKELRVKAGSKSTIIAYWQWTKEVSVKDDEGKLVLDEEGKPEKDTIRLDRPLIRVAHVFNAEQIEGLPPLELKDKEHVYAWDPVEKAEQIIASSGAAIMHDQSDRAFYSSRQDEIHLPSRENFDAPEKYYDTVLHELGHWTGHASRLNRDMVNLFGSQDYAREELRAEISSWMLSQDLGIAHNPEQHAAYVASWIKSLKDDPFEIMRACRDAESIKEYVMGLGLEQQHEKENALSPSGVNQTTSRADGYSSLPRSASLDEEANGLLKKQKEMAKEKTFLDVPYAEKDQAKKLGARWDGQRKSWFAPEGADLNSLERWLPRERALPPQALDAAGELAQAIGGMGGDLQGAMPALNGKVHRLPALGRPAGNKDFAYCAYADGLPAGWMQNHATGEKRNWKFSGGHVLTEEQKVSLRLEAEGQRALRLQEQDMARDAVARQCAEYFAARSPAASDHPYLAAKGVEALGLKESETGRDLLVPLLSVKGEIRGLQRIDGSGFKGFQAGAEKKGNFFVVGCGFEDLGKQKEALIAEGYATAASLHMATKLPCVVAFDAGNLLPVAENIRSLLPDAAIAVCADNDHAHKLQNIGVLKAKAAAEKIRAKLIVPCLTPEERKTGCKDFNDIHQRRGPEAVKKQIEAALGKRRGHDLGL